MSTANPFDFFFQWHLTERCNLRCLHCYQDGKPSVEMAPDEIDRTVKILSDTISRWSELYEIPFSPGINVTGGEPLLHPDLYSILGSLNRNKFSIYLLSNGTLIDKIKAAMLAEIPVKGVQVSIEGPEEVHDRIRGKGSLQSSMRGIRHLLAQNIKVTLNLTLSELNVDSIEETASLASSLGVQRLGFSRLVPSGRGMGLIDRMLSKEKIREAYTRIRSMKVPNLEIVTGDPIYSCAWEAPHTENPNVPFGGCAAAVSGITILPDGTLLPCRRLNIPLGNILKDDLRVIWTTSPVLSGLRNKKRYKGKCRTCDRWAQCRGCRAIAYNYSLSLGKGSYLAEDPQCFMGE